MTVPTLLQDIPKHKQVPKISEKKTFWNSSLHSADARGSTETFLHGGTTTLLLVCSNLYSWFKSESLTLVSVTTIIHCL